MLPREIVERVLNSRVPEAHYSIAGAALLKIAEKRRKDDYPFQNRVALERKALPPLPERTVKWSFKPVELSWQAIRDAIVDLTKGAVKGFTEPLSPPQKGGEKVWDLGP